MNLLTYENFVVHILLIYARISKLTIFCLPAVFRFHLNYVYKLYRLQIKLTFMFFTRQQLIVLCFSRILLNIEDGLDYDQNICFLTFCNKVLFDNHILSRFFASYIFFYYYVLLDQK